MEEPPPVDINRLAKELGDERAEEAARREAERKREEERESTHDRQVRELCQHFISGQEKTRYRGQILEDGTLLEAITLNLVSLYGSHQMGESLSSMHPRTLGLSKLYSPLKGHNHQTFKVFLSERYVKTSQR